MNRRRYRVIDPESQGPISAIEITGPPTSQLAIEIAARAFEGITPGATRDEVLHSTTARLVAKSIDGDKLLRWVVNRLHANFEEAEGSSVDNNEIQLNFSADGLAVTFYPIETTGEVCLFPRRRVLVTARVI